MVNFSFRRLSRRERMKFFQSSPPYLNNNGVTSFSRSWARKWSLEEPHPSNRRILTLANGHYGIYFSLLNQELRRNENDHVPFHDTNGIIVILPKMPALLFEPDFFISKANQIIHNDINELKSFSQSLCSSLSQAKPKGFLLRLCPARTFSTSASRVKNESPVKAADETAEHIQYHAVKPTETPEATVLHEVQPEVPFEESFLTNLINQISAIYSNAATPEDLNRIYPLYQSLKRNLIPLPTIQEYNIVLDSLARRSLDDKPTLSETESKLTNILTVYQDILATCAIKKSCHPDSKTYEIILSAIFGSTRNLLLQTSSSLATEQAKQAVFSMAREFMSVGSDLFVTLKSKHGHLSQETLTDILSCFNQVTPQNKVKSVAEVFLAKSNYLSNSGEFYEELLRFSRYFGDVLGMPKKLTYDFVSAAFTTYKNQALAHPEMKNHEYQVYEALLCALVKNGNISVAAKFLDQIIVDFQAEVKVSNISQGRAHQMSLLLSSYLNALLGTALVDSLQRAVNLISVFQQVPYLPELTTLCYESAINCLISEYLRLEANKFNAENQLEVERMQKDVYEKAWNLYNFVAIRADFQQTGPSFFREPSSRENLLSLSLDLGDHSNTSRLIKEIMIQNHPISDLNISRKICQYLLSGAHASQSSPYLNLMWAFLEQQASHHEISSKELHEFLSAHVDFLVHESYHAKERLLNSRLVLEAFKRFRLGQDNIYGLVTIMEHFRKNISSALDGEEAIKVLLFQSHLINEFEETENFYLHLCSDLVEFKRNLCEFFSSLLKQTRAGPLRTSFHKACTSLNIATEGIPTVEPKIYLDLTSYFAINRGLGIKQFLHLASLGFNFTELTWSATLNRDFISDVLIDGRNLSHLDLYRLMSSAKNPESAFCHLFSLQHDETNIKALKFLVDYKKEDLLSSEKLLMALAMTVAQSDNKLFFTSIATHFAQILQYNPSKLWLSSLIEAMQTQGRAKEIAELVSVHCDGIIASVDMSDETDLHFLSRVLKAYTRAGKLNEVGKILAQRFSGSLGNKMLLGSDTLLACLLEYYISAGSYELVCKKFGSLSNRSEEVSQLIEFANCLSNMTGATAKQSAKTPTNVDALGNLLLAERDLRSMQHLFEECSVIVQNRELFLRLLVSKLQRAAEVVDEKYLYTIRTALEKVVKFCKVLRIDNVSNKVMLDILRLLTTTKSFDLLNILLSKFLVNGSILPYLNFFFLTVKINSPAEAKALLQEFRIASKKSEDLNARFTEAVRLNPSLSS